MTDPTRPTITGYLPPKVDEVWTPEAVEKLIGQKPAVNGGPGTVTDAWLDDDGGVHITVAVESVSGRTEPEKAPPVKIAAGRVYIAPAGTAAPFGDEADHDEDGIEVEGTRTTPPNPWADIGYLAAASGVSFSEPPVVADLYHGAPTISTRDHLHMDIETRLPEWEGARRRLVNLFYGKVKKERPVLVPNRRARRAAARSKGTAE